MLPSPAPGVQDGASGPTPSLSKKPKKPKKPKRPKNTKCLGQPAILRIRVPVHPRTLTIPLNSTPEPLASVRNSERVPYVHIPFPNKPWLTDNPPVQPISEKIGGLTQEIKGKIKHDPELIKHGRDQRTGELKRKEMRQVNSLRL